MTEQEKQVWYDALKERANQPGTYAVTGGMRVAELGDGWARGELLLEERHRNPMGIVHGGVYCTMMDQVAGSAACTRGSMCRTVNCEVRFLAAAQGAHLTSARRRCAWAAASPLSGRGWRTRRALCAPRACTPSA